MLLSQQPAVPSELVGVQASAAELLGQLVLSVEKVEAFPLHPLPSSSHPIGHTSDPSVSASRSHAGDRVDKLSGTASASTNCPYEWAVAGDSPVSRNA